MKFNEAEVSHLLNTKTPDWEGPLMYKPPKSSSSFPLSSSSAGQFYKERYFKLVGNLLFCLRHNDEREPLSLTVLEGATLRREQDQQLAFTLAFGSETENSEKVHSFVAENSRTVTQWIEALQQASYERKREALILLQIKLRNKTGIDPLRGTALEHNPVYCGPKDCPSLLPAPPARRNKGKQKNGAPPSSFTSHLGVQSWESENIGHSGHHNLNGEVVLKHKPSFKSHVKGECEGVGGEDGNILRQINVGDDSSTGKPKRPSFRSHVPVDTLVEL